MTELIGMISICVAKVTSSFVGTYTNLMQVEIIGYNGLACTSYLRMVIVGISPEM